MAFVILLIIAPNLALSRLILSNVLSKTTSAATAFLRVFTLTVLSLIKSAEPGVDVNKPLVISA